MIHHETVDSNLFNLIRELQAKEYLKNFILVGGTALALIIGHRISEDIDLFSDMDFNNESILEKLESNFGFQMDLLEHNTLGGSIQNIKVDLISHKYPIIKEPLNFEGIRISSIEDISAMKINAISNNGTRAKDFIDIYFLLDLLSLEEMLGFYKEKYQLRNALHALKSLNYFDEVEIADWPKMIIKKDLKWKDVMNRIDNECNALLRNL